MPDTSPLDRLRSIDPSSRLAPSVRADLLRFADLAFPFEACGLLLGCDPARVDRLVLTRNLEPSRNRFKIDPADLARAERRARHRGRRLLGFWHSHPGAHGALSEADRRGLWPGYLQVVVAVEASGRGEVWAYEASRLEPIQRER